METTTAPAPPLLTDNFEALMAAMSCLPPFPGQPLTASPENLRNAYTWATGMVQIYGDRSRAWQAARAEKEKAASLNGTAVRGWENVEWAIFDLYRLPLPGETVH